MQSTKLKNTHSKNKAAISAAEVKLEAASSKGARAREALMDAAFELLGEMSPRELTPGAICIAAQMKRPSFYTYFDSVEGLLDMLIRREIDRLEALYDAQENKRESALHRVAGVPLSLVALKDSDKGRLHGIVTLMSADFSFTHLRLDNLRRDIKAAIAEGGLTLKPTQIDVFMQIYVAGILSLMARHAESELSRMEVVTALQVFLKGAGADAKLLKSIFAG